MTDSQFQFTKRFVFISKRLAETESWAAKRAKNFVKRRCVHDSSALYNQLSWYFGGDILKTFQNHEILSLFTLRHNLYKPVGGGTAAAVCAVSVNIFQNNRLDF